MPDNNNSSSQVADSAKDAKDKIEQQARAYGDEARERASEAGDKMTDKAVHLASEAQNKAVDYGDRALGMASDYTDKMHEQTERARNQVASGMDSAADLVRDRSEGIAGVGKAGSFAAEGMESAAAYVREHRSEDMLSDVMHFARKRPLLAAIGAIIGVIFLMRMMK